MVPASSWDTELLEGDPPFSDSLHCGFLQVNTRPPGLVEDFLDDADPDDTSTLDGELEEATNRDCYQEASQDSARCTTQMGEEMSEESNSTPRQT